MRHKQADRALAYFVRELLAGETLRDMSVKDVASETGLNRGAVKGARQRAMNAVVTGTVDELAQYCRDLGLRVDPPPIVLDLKQGPPEPTPGPSPEPRTNVVRLHTAAPPDAAPSVLRDALGVLMTPREAAYAAGVPPGSLREARPEAKTALRRARYRQIQRLQARLLAIAMGDPCIRRRVAMGPAEAGEGETPGVEFAEWVDCPGEMMQTAAMKNLLTLLQFQHEAGIMDDPAFVDAAADDDPVEAMLNQPPVFPEMGAVDLMSLGED